MRKLLTVLVTLAVVVAGAWSAFWFYGKNRIVQEIEAQAQSIRDRGGEASYARIDVGGFPFGYTGRIVEPTLTGAQVMTIDLPAEAVAEGTDPAAAEPFEIRNEFTWSAPWIEARAGVTAPNTVTFTFPEDHVVALKRSAGGEELEQVGPLDVVTKDMRVVTIRNGEGVDFDGDAASIGTIVSREDAETGRMDLTATLRDIEASGRMEQRADRGSPPFRVEYTASGLDGAMEVQGAAESGQNGTAEFDFGSMRTLIDGLGDTTVGTSTMEDVKVSIRAEQLGGTPLDFGVARISADTRIPNSPGPEAQPFAYEFSLDEVTLADLVWTLADPTAAFPREINRVALSMEGDAIFRVDPMDTQAMIGAMQDGLTPIDAKRLEIGTLEIDALGLKADGTGDFRLDGAAAKGEATLGIEGLPGFIEAAVRSGRVPEQQAMIAQLMIENFGKAEGDTVRFDIEIRDDGQFYVNGIPIGAAPALPR